jgi:hypothetical protein
MFIRVFGGNSTRKYTLTIGVQVLRDAKDFKLTLVKPTAPPTLLKYTDNLKS